MIIADSSPGRITDAPEIGDPLLKTIEAARYLSVSPRKLQSEVASGRIRKHVLARPGATKGPVRFRRSDLDAYIASCAVEAVPRGPRT